MPRSCQRDIDKMLAQRLRRHGIDRSFSVYLDVLSRGVKLAAMRRWFVQELCIQAMLTARYDEREAAQILGMPQASLRKYLIEWVKRSGPMISKERKVT